MTTPTEQFEDELKPFYWVIGLLLLILVVIGLVTYSGQKESEAANQKAAELTAKYVAAGLTPPDKNIIIRTLGDDGGNICDNPANGLGVALVNDQLTNGGSHVGRRPVIASTTSLEGQRLILETYCPDELADFQEELSEYKTDDTIKE